MVEGWEAVDQGEWVVALVMVEDSVWIHGIASIDTRIITCRLYYAT